MHATLDPDLHLGQDVPDGFELVDGELVETTVSLLSSRVAVLLSSRLTDFCHTHQAGDIFGADLCCRCFKNPRTVRKPDVTFVRAGRLGEKDLEAGELKIAPDLAVEVVSPNDTTYEVDRKVEEFLEAGIRLIWVINPDGKHATVFRQDRSISRVRASEELDGEDVIPGFRCPLALLFPPFTTAST